MSAPSAAATAAIPIRTGSLAVALAVGVVVAAGLAFIPAVLNDGDTFLHVRAGEAMLDTGTILRIDPFSATKAGAPWQTHEWLAQIALGLAHRLGGWTGVLLLTALAGGIASFQMTRAIGRHVEPAYAVLMVAIGFLLAAPSLLARPHVLVLPLLTTVLVEALAAVEARRTPRWWLIVPALGLWANMHGSFVIGFAVLSVAGLEALVAGWQAAGRAGAVGVVGRWGAVGVAAIAATVAGPHGLDTLLFPLLHSASPALAHIGEWQPLNFAKPNAFEGAAALLILMLSRGVVVAPTRILPVLGLMYMAVTHVRHLLLLGLIAPVLLAPALGRLRPPPPLGTGARRRGRRAGGLVVIVGLAILALRVGLPVAPGDTETTPVSAVAAVPADLRQRPVFNDYAFGAYLIFADVPPVIDSRVELYGAAFIGDYAGIINSRCQLAVALQHQGAAWTIFAPRGPAVATLDHLPGWTRIHTDAFAVVHRRDEPPAPLPAACVPPTD